MRETSRQAVAAEINRILGLEQRPGVRVGGWFFGKIDVDALVKAVLKKHDPLREANKVMGRQGQTIHLLRAEIEQVRSESSKIDRGELRRSQRIIADLNEDLARATEEIITLQEKLDDQEELAAVTSTESTQVD